MNMITHLLNKNGIRNLIPHMSLKEIHNYWRSPTDEDNLPLTYLEGEKRSEFLTEIFNQQNIDKKSKILELGCNVGRNLNFLFKCGYKELFGVEINLDAIQLMKTYYPELAKYVTVYNSTIEEKIKQFKDESFDVVFTMATLMHIHTESEFTFAEMVRVVKNCLITIEAERGIGRKNFERNYKLVFEKLGLKEISSINCKSIPELDNPACPSIYARIFKKSN